MYLYLLKNKFFISILIIVVLVVSLPFLLDLPFFVKLVGKNYLPKCDQLQTEVIELLYDTARVKPAESIIKCENGKLWKEVAFEVDLPYGIEIAAVLNKLKGAFDLNFETIKENDYFGEYKLFYKDLPIQSFKIYREHPKVAIIFDDVGESLSLLKNIIELNVPTTVSILPFLNNSRESGILAKQNNVEVMLHLPMEPYDSKVTSGNHTIKTDMSEKEIIKWTSESIQKVPYVKGVNNHMGSKATEARSVMETVLGVIKSNRLYFIDSKTSSESVALEIAKELGIPSGANRCYIDNENNKDYIKKRLNLLKEIVLTRGQAIAIGHCREKTIDMIKEYIPKFKDEGIEFKRVSELLEKKEEDL